MFFFFDEVEIFLHESIDPTLGESYVKDKDFGFVTVDFFLPNGCVKWNYPPDTIIKVIETFKAGTIYQARRDIMSIRKSFCDINAYYIFCKEVASPENIPLRSVKKTENIIHVIDFNNLRVIKKLMFEDDDFWQEKQRKKIANAKSNFKIGGVSLFLGAGLSISCGLPGWDNLLNMLISSLRNNKALSVNDYYACMNDSHESLLIKARYLKQFYTEAKMSFVSNIREVLYKQVDDEGELLKSVVRLIKTGNVATVISYNYDDLLEEALQKESIKFTPIDRSNRPVIGTLPILHIHGFIPREEDADYERNVVLSEEDYHSLYRNAYHWANIEQLHALSQTTCYFIGLSLKDPSLRRLLDIAYERGYGNAVHYAFLRRNEFQQPMKAEVLFYKMGINVIWYNNVNELPSIVDSLTEQS